MKKEEWILKIYELIFNSICLCDFDPPSWPMVSIGVSKKSQISICNFKRKNNNIIRIIFDSNKRHKYFINITTIIKDNQSIEHIKNTELIFLNEENNKMFFDFRNENIKPLDDDDDFKYGAFFKSFEEMFKLCYYKLLPKNYREISLPIITKKLCLMIKQVFNIDISREIIINNKKYFLIIDTSNIIIQNKIDDLFIIKEYSIIIKNFVKIKFINNILKYIISNALFSKN